MDGLVSLKIIKHCTEEGTGGDLVQVGGNVRRDIEPIFYRYKKLAHGESIFLPYFFQGVLLGLVVDNRLEVTNCFPFPRNAGNEEGEDFDEVKLERFSSVACDHDDNSQGMGALRSSAYNIVTLAFFLFFFNPDPVSNGDDAPFAPRQR